MTGILNLSNAPGQAGAPAAAAAPLSGLPSPVVPENATLAASQQGAWLRGTNSSLISSQAQVQILCRPVPARRADAGQSTAAEQQSSGRGGFYFDTVSLWLLVNEVAMLWFALGMFVASRIFLEVHRCGRNQLTSAADSRQMKDVALH